MIENHRAESIEPRWVALLSLIEKVTLAGSTVTEEDVSTVRSAGWTDEAIYDAITVCALFNFYNAWVDGCGVKGLADYTASGKRMAADGYIQPPPEPST